MASRSQPLLSEKGGQGNARTGVMAALDDYFEVTKRGSTMAVEVRGGCIAWMTMSYIMVVNPVILSAANPERPLEAAPLMSATAFAAAIGSLAIGVLGKAPFAMMPGMGLNAYFTYGICHQFGLSWQQAMSSCFVAGVALLLLAALGVCHWLVRKALSEHLKKAITVAIGVFQAMIGFQVMGLIETSQDTMLELGDVSFSNTRLYLALAGFLLIVALTVTARVHGAILIGMVTMSVCAWALRIHEPPQGFLEWPSFDYSLSVDFSAWSQPGTRQFTGVAVGSVVLLFVALFDIAGVQYGLSHIAGLLQDGMVPRSSGIFASAGVGTIAGALLGTSPVIIANECSAGIMEGAVTGVSALVVSALFCLSAFMAPVLAAIPHVATAVPLVLIGAFMMAPCSGIDWEDLSVAIPSFLTVTVVPFTYSIHNGILAGILMDAFLALLQRACCCRSASMEVEDAPKSPYVLTPNVDDRKAKVRQMLSDISLQQRSSPTMRDHDLCKALEAYLGEEIDADEEIDEDLFR